MKVRQSRDLLTDCHSSARLRERIRAFHIADDRFPTIIDMHMLDADELLPAVTQPSKNLNLHRICFEPNEPQPIRTPQLAALLPKATSSFARKYAGAPSRCEQTGR